MAHAARILADSISPDGVRLTTMEVVIPRIVLAEFNTHRMFSRNSASSRAIPVEKMLKRVQEDPYVPSEWGKNQKGMQADETLNDSDSSDAHMAWLDLRDMVVAGVQNLLSIGVHKQLTNRWLETCLWHTIIVSATEWDNFFHLRCHPDAHPDIRKTAELMWECLERGVPKELTRADWHLPLVYDEDYEQAILENPTNPVTVMKKLVKVSVGRCARVTHLTHDGKRDLQADVELHGRLLQSGHMSPFEHVARPMALHELNKRCRWYVELTNGKIDWTPGSIEWRPGVGQPLKAGVLTDVYVKRVIGWRAFEGNFNGWMQYRKTIPREWDIKGPAES